MNFPTEIGLDKYASHPPSRMRSSSPFMANAVTATTGIERNSSIVLDPARDFEAGHLRQLDIHQDQVGMQCLRTRSSASNPFFVPEV